MKFYNKKLDSLEALRREKIRLRYERRQTKSSDLNPLADMGQGKTKTAAQAGLMGTLIGLASSKGNLDTIMMIGKPLLKMLRQRKKKSQELYVGAAGKVKKNSALKKLVAEVAINYMIGKAVQMSVRGIQMYMRKRKAR